MLCIILFGLNNGAKRIWKGKDLRDDRWGFVDDSVQAGDFNKLVYLGNPDQPDYYYYLDGINRGWRPEFAFQQITPAPGAPIQPLPGKPGNLVIVQHFWARQANWSAEDLAFFLQDYTVQDQNEHFSVYRYIN